MTTTGMTLDVVLGVDIGGTNVHSGVVTLEGELLSTSVLPIKDYGVHEVLNLIVNSVEEALEEAELALEKKEQAEAVAAGTGGEGGRVLRPLGVGIGVPGICDFSTGKVCRLANVKEWVDCPLASLVGSKLGSYLTKEGYSYPHDTGHDEGEGPHPLPAALDNDATCAVAAEYWVGAGRDLHKQQSSERKKENGDDESERHDKHSSLVVLTLGTGIGGGMVDNGSIVRGRGLAGELVSEKASKQASKKERN